MKGIVLGLISFVFFLCVSVLLLRVRLWKKHFQALLLASASGLAFYALGYLYTPVNLWFLPAGWLEPSSAVDCFNGFLLLALIIHCFWDFLYVFAITGFSTGLLIRVSRFMPDGTTVEDLVETYRGCGGMDNIFARRIPKLIQGGYIRQDGGYLRLTSKGRAFGFTVLAIRKLLNVREGG